MAKLEDDLNALFQLPLAEFIAGRKALATRLKKDGRTSEADQIKSLPKPSISVWTVNQLYWNHRDEFEELIAAGQRFRKAQKSGKVTDMRDALDARRETLNELSDLATELLRDAGHNPSLDVSRRVTSTLEAMSAFASFPADIHPGRLTEDIDPPGFDSFTFAAASAASTSLPKQPARPAASRDSPKSKAPLSGKTNRDEEVRRARQERIATAKASLQEAKKTLSEARARAKSLEASQKKADTVVKEAEKQKLEAESRFRKANTSALDAARRARGITAELEEATAILKRAQRDVDAASKELETAFQESPGK